MSGTPGKSGGRRGPPLNQRERRFCHEYVIDGNGAQAAIRAGYAASDAKHQAHELLKRAPVRDLIATLQAQREARLKVTGDDAFLLAYGMATTAENEGARIKAIELVCKLTGRLKDQTTQHNHTHKHEHVHLTKEERQHRIAALLGHTASRNGHN